MAGIIVVNGGRCKGCALCALVCPKNLVHMAVHYNSKGYHPASLVDPDGKCTGCTLCAIICPDVAIAVYRRR